MRRLRFWLRLLFYPLFLAALVVIVAGCWLAGNLARVVAWGAARALPEFSLQLGDAELVGFHRIEFSEVALTDRSQKNPALSIEAVAVDYSLAGLWHHRIARVELEHPRFALNDQTLAKLSGTQTGPATPNDNWRVEQFSVRSGTAAFDLRGQPRISFEFAGEFTDSPTATQRLALKKIRVAESSASPQPFLEASAAHLAFTFRDLARHQLAELTLAAPSVHLQPALLAAFSATQGAGSPNEPGWQVGKLKIRDGELFVEGFSAAVPVASAKFFLETTDLGWGGASEKLHAMQIWDVRGAPLFDPLHPFLLLDSLTIKFSNAGLARRELAQIETTGLWLGLGRNLRTFASAPDPKTTRLTTSTTPASSSPPWMVRDFSIASGDVAMSDLGLDIPDLGFYVRTRLHDVALSGDGRLAGTQLQTVELSNIAIHSPLDPFAPVLNFPTVFVRFSLARLLQNEIEEVSLLSPQIFVGEDLFWYADTLQQQAAASSPNETPTPGNGAPHWVVKNLGADLGQIIIANGGKNRATLPLNFSWRAQQVDFSNLRELRLKLKLVVPEGDYLFPSYELDLVGLSGRIEFGLPPEGHKDNLVHTLEVKEARWKQFVAGQSYVSVTYDKKGIYGEVGAKAYGGYLNGGFSFLTQPDSPWIGWMSGSAINLGGVTDALAPQNFQLKGPADFKLEVNGLNHEIERLAGTYTMRRPGRLRVTKLNDLLGAIPPEWTTLKQSLTRIGLETLRDFDYDRGDGSFWFANHEGSLKLALRGAGGSRTLEAVLHGPRERPPFTDE